jgi:hypothetical protein
LKQIRPTSSDRPDGVAKVSSKLRSRRGNLNRPIFGPSNSMKITSNSPLFIVVACFGLSALFAPATFAQSRAPLWTNYSRVDPETLTVDDKGNHLLCTDNNGNVIVAGLPLPVPPYDYVTVKISSSGESLWTNRFSSPGNNQDVASFVAVDGANNVFVTGYATYSPADEDYVTIKYSSAGIPLWTNRYNGPAGSYDEATSMAVDSAGNVIVTGTSFNGGGGREWATVKYSNSGTLRWAQRYGDPGSSDAWAVSVAVDSTNIYVLGYNTVGDFATVAYSSLSGRPLWTNNYGPGYFVSRPEEIATDNKGHVFVTGYAPKNSTYPFDEDYVTLAYSSTGLPLWTNLYVGLGLSFDNDDRAVGLAVSHGRVFVLGSSMGADGRQEFATVAYSTAGALLWTDRFAGDWGFDYPVAIAADRVGNVFVTGLRGDATLNSEIYVIKAYSGAGTLLWTNEMIFDLIAPNEIAVNSSGEVFVTGSGTSGGVTLKYAASLPRLTFQWLNKQFVITWDNPDCVLQASPSVIGTFTDIVGATSPYTNSATGLRQFFRLNCN